MHPSSSHSSSSPTFTTLLVSPHNTNPRPSFILLPFSLCRILPLSELRTQHPEWCRDAAEELIGWTYDGRAALFCSVGLDFLSTPPVCAIPSRGELADMIRPIYYIAIHYDSFLCCFIVSQQLLLVRYLLTSTHFAPLPSLQAHLLECSATIQPQATRRVTIRKTSTARRCGAALHTPHHTDLHPDHQLAPVSHNSPNCIQPMSFLSTFSLIRLHFTILQPHFLSISLTLSHNITSYYITSLDIT